MSSTALRTANGYRATKTELGLLVHDVPIFTECKREIRKKDGEVVEVSFDADWIDAAVKRAKLKESEDDYSAPLHVKHHDSDPETNREVGRAGVLKNFRSKRIRFEGKDTQAIVADLLVTEPRVADDVLQMRLPYRSVEILNCADPFIDSLALLDHQVPFLRLPMLRVKEIEDTPEWSLTSSTDGSLAMSFCGGSVAHLLFREEGPLADKPDDDFGAGVDADDALTFEGGKPPVPDPAKPPAPGGDGEGGDEGGEPDTPGKIDSASVIAAINDGSIPIADFDELWAAMEARKATAGGQPQLPQQPGQQQQQAPRPGVPAPVPGAATMKNEPSELSAQFAEQQAAMQGEIDALKLREQERESQIRRSSDVADAMKRLEGRPLGDLVKFEQTLNEHHEKFGPDAFKFFVDSFAEKIGGKSPSDPEGSVVTGDQYPEVAMAYQDQGPDAVDQAVRFCADWEEAKAHKVTSLTQERYVELAMRRAARQSA